MKALSIKILCVFAVLFSFSCKKQLIEKYQNNTKPTDAKTFSEIKTNSGFGWNTTSSISFSYSAINDDVRIMVLKIMDTKGNPLFTKLQKVREDFNATIELPTNLDSLVVDFGGITKSYSLQSKEINIQLP